MARVLPFPALLTPPAGAAPSDETAVRPLLEAVDPAAALGRWRAEGRLTRAGGPALYLLEVRRVAGAPVRYLLCGLEADGSEPLEHTPYRPRSPLTEPAVALAADDHGLLRELLAEAAAGGTRVWEGTLDGAPTTLLRLEPSPLIRRLQAALDEAPLRPLAELPERGPGLAAVVPLSDPGLHLAPVHRALRGLPTFREDTFLTLVGQYARTYELAEPLTSARGLAAARERLATLVTGHHAVLLVLPGGRGRILRFRQGLDLAHLKAAPRNPTLRSLDLALLNAVVLRTVLGIPDPDAAGHPQVHAIEGLEALVAGVEAGTFQVGFGLNPPPVWEVRAVMEADATLPARTLRVDPAPPSGLLFLDPGP